MVDAPGSGDRVRVAVRQADVADAPARPGRRAPVAGRRGAAPAALQLPLLPSGPVATARRGSIVRVWARCPRRPFAGEGASMAGPRSWSRMLCLSAAGAVVVTAASVGSAVASPALPSLAASAAGVARVAPAGAGWELETTHAAEAAAA